MSGWWLASSATSATRLTNAIASAKSLNSRSRTSSPSSSRHSLISSPPMRIVSLVPHATELLFALGLGDQVVGVTHECDHPAEARERRHVTRDRLPAGLSTRRRSTPRCASTPRAARRSTRSTRPCCATSRPTSSSPRRCARSAPSPTRTSAAIAERLDPRAEGRLARPEDVRRDARRRPHDRPRDRREDRRRRRSSRGPRERVDAVEAAVKDVARRPRVAAIEWFDPVFVAGHWTPQLIEMAGGDDVLGFAGEHSEQTTWEVVAAARARRRRRDAVRLRRRALARPRRCCYADRLREVGAGAGRRRRRVGVLLAARARGSSTGLETARAHPAPRPRAGGAGPSARGRRLSSDARSSTCTRARAATGPTASSSCSPPASTATATSRSSCSPRTARCAPTSRRRASRSTSGRWPCCAARSCRRAGWRASPRRSPPTPAGSGAWRARAASALVHTNTSVTLGGDGGGADRRGAARLARARDLRGLRALVARLPAPARHRRRAAVRLRRDRGAVRRRPGAASSTTASPCATSRGRATRRARALDLAGGRVRRRRARADLGVEGPGRARPRDGRPAAARRATRSLSRRAVAGRGAPASASCASSPRGSASPTACASSASATTSTSCSAPPTSSSSPPPIPTRCPTRRSRPPRPGCCVVAAGHGGLPEIVRDGETGVLVPAGDHAGARRRRSPRSTADDRGDGSAPRRRRTSSSASRPSASSSASRTLYDELL